jgi:hypothetical protein
MYARLTTTKPDTSPQTVLDAAADQPGFAGGYASTHVSGIEGLAITLWKDIDSAGDDAFEVIHSARIAGDVGAMNVVTFAAPITDEMRAAADYAGRNRIEPFAAGLPGALGVLVLWDDARRVMKAVSMATDLDRLGEIGHALNSMELLPDEDPALLPQVDRVDVFRVLDGR